MMKAKKGDWVRIYNILLTPDQRAPQVPEDTSKVPMELWDKGFLINDTAEIGEEVTVETYIGRIINGKLIEINPSYGHDYGKCVPELLYIGRQVKGLLKEGESDDQR
jgi:hypothetical protein